MVSSASEQTWKEGIRPKDSYFRDMKPLLLTVLITVALALGSCTPRAGTSEVPSPQKPSRPRPQAEEAKLPALVSKMNDFSWSLYQNIARDRTGNLVASPIGSFLLLELLYEGAEAPAKNELETILGRPEHSLSEVGLLAWDLNSLSSLRLAQKIYVDDKAELVASYGERVEPLLGSSVETVPLSTSPDKAAESMSRWVEEQTGGLMREAVPALSEETSCVLISTLYFQGRWDQEFPKEDTRPSEFTLGDGTKVRVPMMRLSEAPLKTFSMEKGQGLVLPYVDETEMVLLLPKLGVPPDDLWPDLDPEAGLGRYTSKEPLVNLELPRFEFEAPRFELTEHWRSLGLDKILSQANLKSMITWNPATGMNSKVFQQAYIKVDEKGTEAAAVTDFAVTESTTAPPDEEAIITLRFDRPFSFLLRHSTTGTVLLMGRVERPSEWD